MCVFSIQICTNWKYRCISGDGIGTEGCVRRKEFSWLASVVEHGDVLSNMEMRYILYQSQVG